MMVVADVRCDWLKGTKWQQWIDLVRPRPATDGIDLSASTQTGNQADRRRTHQRIACNDYAHIIAKTVFIHMEFMVDCKPY